jgi:hypothetical protein
MRINRGLLGWGVFFIVLGSVPLAVRANAVDPVLVRRAGELWPLILVGIGLGLVLERTRIAVVGALVVAVTSGLMGGALIATGIGGTGGLGACGLGNGSRPATAIPPQSGVFSGSASARIELDCGDVTVSATDAAQWTVAGTGDEGRAPTVTSEPSRLVVRAPERRGINLGVDGSYWDVMLPRSVPTSIELSVNAGSGHVNLAGMAVPAFDLSVNAGDARIDLSGATAVQRVTASANAGSLVLLLPMPTGTLGGDLSVNAGSAKVCVPQGVAIRFRGGGDALGSTNFAARGLVKVGETWTSPGFEGAGSRIDLSVSANLGSITLDPEDGCD